MRRDTAQSKMPLEQAASLALLSREVVLSRFRAMMLPTNRQDVVSCDSLCKQCDTASFVHLTIITGTQVETSMMRLDMLQLALWLQVRDLLTSPLQMMRVH